jgi:hypothetical protein
MIGDNGRNDDFDDVLDDDDDLVDDDDDLLDDDDDEVDEDEMPDIGGDTLIDISGELRVDDLVAKSSKTDPDEAAHRREVRRRLEELDERRKNELDDTFNINLDDEL